MITIILLMLCALSIVFGVMFVLQKQYNIAGLCFLLFSVSVFAFLAYTGNFQADIKHSNKEVLQELEKDLAEIEENIKMMTGGLK